MIKRNTLGEQIFDAVIDMIEKGGYSVGDMLPTEKEIAHKLGVSRNSLREVMKSLSISGAVQSIAGKGTFLLKDTESIRCPSITDAVSQASTLELLQARMIIETEAAVLAAQNAKKESFDYKDFEKSLMMLNSAFDNKSNGTGNEKFQFHIELVKLCGNRFLYKMFCAIIKDMQNSREIASVNYNNAECEKEIHYNIFEAVIKGDVDRARKAMKKHFENTIEYCKSLK